MSNPFSETQRLDDLLARDAKAFPHSLKKNPWFPARMAALARETPQRKISPIQNILTRFAGLSRWLLPLPLVGAGAMLLLTSHTFHAPSTLPTATPTTTISPDSEEMEFEEHMEMLASNDQ